MPWKETCIMDQRVAFISCCLRDEAPMSELCAAFGISRNTGYKWLRRYGSEGPAGLQDRSRAQRGVDRLLRNIDALAGETLLEFGQRDVRLRGHHRVQPVRPAVTAAIIRDRRASG